MKDITAGSEEEIKVNSLDGSLEKNWTFPKSSWISGIFLISLLQDYISE